jgi:AcrR family transcriptional regulator
MNAQASTDPAEPGASGVDQARVPYSSPVRSAQARSTRRAIVAAAGTLFVEQGYAATTIDAIAERAGVGRKTVFASVGGKGALLKLVWDWAIAGDDETIPMSERPAVQAIRAEGDPARLVRMWVDMQLDVGSRVTPIAAVVLAAADVDADARALRDTIRRETLAGATAFVTHLAAAGGLRADLTIDRGAEACWALMNSLLEALLVGSRGWSRPQYGDWLVRVAAATLLQPPGDASSPPASAAVRIMDEATRARYVALVSDRVVGHLSYQRAERLVMFTRTEVDPGFEDRGVADALVRTALDDLRADGTRRVVPVCPYTTWWITRHPDYAALLYDATAD